MKHRLLIIAGVAVAVNVVVAWALLAWSHHICAMFAGYSKQWDFMPGFGDAPGYHAYQNKNHNNVYEHREIKNPCQGITPPHGLHRTALK